MMLVFIYFGFYVTFNTVQVISQRLVGRAEETTTYSSLGFCTVNCQPTASKYQLSHLRPCHELNPGLRGGRRECYTLPPWPPDDACEQCLFSKIFTLKNVQTYFRDQQDLYGPVVLHLMTYAGSF